jgi:hypothetical protein
MECRGEPKRALHGVGRGGRRREKPRKRWLSDVEDDLRKIGVKRWRIMTMDRTEWRKKGKRSRP